ncbi:MAG TPA: pitrilysin family protein [Candidatus Polarisedimenticolaceae bacterium]|nr:pitrilysin family protein [Candidatus Polarisedimenticolaceae bacterium]
MSRAAVALALMAALTACSGPRKDGTVANSSEGGAGVVRLPVPDDPTVTFKVWFRVGSQDDPPGKAGLANLTAQMLASAATTRNAYEEVLRQLYPLASAYEIEVDREMTVLSGRTHRDNVERFLGLYADALARPAFKTEDFARLKSDTLNYLKTRLRYESDEELAKAALYGFVFDGTGYRHPPEGTVAGLEAITLDDVRTFYREHFTRDTAVPAIGGGFDAALEQRFLAAVAELPQGRPATAPAPQPASIEASQVLLVSKPGADASISFGYPIDVKRGSREFYALWVANSWLGEHRSSSSHLFQVIREARGLNYGDYSYIEAYPRGGRREVPPPHVGRRSQLFEVWIRTLPANQAHFAVRAALREVQALAERGLTAEQFELTRTFLQKYVLHFAEATGDRLAYAVDDRFYGIEPPGHLERFRKVLGELTLDEVNAAARKYLRADRVKFAVVTGDAEGLRQALATDAPSPIEYKSPKPQAVQDEDREIARFPAKVAESAIHVVPVTEVFER